MRAVFRDLGFGSEMCLVGVRVCVDQRVASHANLLHAQRGEKKKKEEGKKKRREVENGM